MLKYINPFYDGKIFLYFFQQIMIRPGVPMQCLA